MKKIFFYFPTLLFCGLTTILAAQTFSLAHVAPDARMLAMGNTGVAQMVSSFSLYSNTAATVLSADRMSLAASYGIWQPGVQNNRLMGASGYFKVGERFAVAAGTRVYTYPQVTFYDNNGYAKGNYKPLEFSAELGFAYRIVQGFAVSANLHYLSADLGAAQKGNAFAADIGLLYTVSGLRIGLTATQLGTQMDFGYGGYSLPASVNAGVGYVLEIGKTHAITPVAEVSYRLPAGRRGIAGGVGMEYSFRKMVSLRAGYHMGSQKTVEPSYFTAGIGLQIAGAALDFVYLLAPESSPLRNTMQLSLGWTLR